MLKLRFMREDRLWDFVDLFGTRPSRAESLARSMSRRKLIDLYNDFAYARTAAADALSSGALSDWSEDALSDAADAIIERGRDQFMATLDMGRTPLSRADLKRGSQIPLLLIRTYRQRFKGEIADEIYDDYASR